MYRISQLNNRYIGQRASSSEIIRRPGEGRDPALRLRSGRNLDPDLRRDDGGAMASQAKFLMVQFLQWVDARPRRVAEARAAWSSTCPLNCAWEDAIADDLVERTADGSLALTARGNARLEEVISM